MKEPHRLQEILDFSILKMGNFHLKVDSLLFLIAFLILVSLFLRLIRKGLSKANRIDAAKKYTIYSLVKYTTIVFSIIIGLQILGFNPSVLLAGSAALLVGLGLGLQNLFSDFFSGIILLVESSLKVNDIIEVNGLVCQVQVINLRTTTVLTREDKYIILPNTDLTRNQIINWTYSNIASRFEVNVGVDYSSDVTQVMQLLDQVIKSQEGIMKSPEPFVRFTNYGDSSIDFTIYFWSEEVFRVEQTKSDLRVRIFKMLQENKITIPFPQRVVHMSQ